MAAGAVVAALAILAYTVVDGTKPPVCTNSILVAKPLLALVETSKPVGAVIVIFAPKPAPDIVNDCAVDAVPPQVVNADKALVTTIPPGTLLSKPYFVLALSKFA